MADRSKNTPHSQISANSIIPIEVTIDRQFFDGASALLKEPRWEGYRVEVYGIHGPAYAIAEFTACYTDLLAWAFVEYMDLLCRAAVASQERIGWLKAEESAFRFLDRFVTGRYHRPWNGDFLRTQEWINRQSAMREYVRLHEIAPWFSPECWAIWERTFIKEVQSGDWKRRAREQARQRIRLIETTSLPLAKTSRRSDVSSENEIQIPDRWKDLLKLKSITQAKAARFLDCSTKTVQRMIKRNELKVTDKSRVICDERLRQQIRKVHGNQVLP